MIKNNGGGNEMKKIAFFDIDGTMVNIPNGMMHPSCETKRVLQEFKKQGNYIVVATARGEIPSSVSDIDFDGYICSDGHYIEFQQVVLVNNIFTKEQIKMQLDVYKKHHGGCILGGHYGQWFDDQENPLTKKHHELYAGTSSIPSDSIIEDCIDTIKANSATGIFSSVKDMQEARKLLPVDWAINAYDTGHIRMDVHLPGFSKGTACQFLYQYLGINKENTYAFGDGENDIEMLQLVGHGIAMKNASERIQEIADEVTDSVDDEGIAKAFKKYFNI